LCSNPVNPENPVNPVQKSSPKPGVHHLPDLRDLRLINAMVDFNLIL
jgi:hypothetical protein